MFGLRRRPRTSHFDDYLRRTANLRHAILLTDVAATQAKDAIERFKAEPSSLNLARMTHATDQLAAAKEHLETAMLEAKSLIEAQP